MKKITVLLIAFWSQINSAQTPLGDYFTYQGELLVNSQVANGNYEFEAQFYDAATNGNDVGNNFNIAATVTDGIFTLQLDIGGGAFEGDEVWLQLLVTPPGGGTQVSLLPRQLITNSPYSIQAKYVGNDGVSTISIVNAAVTTSKLANAAITSAKLAGDSVTSAKIANGTITTADISSQAVTRVQIAANTIQRSEVDSMQIQERVTGICAAGSSIRVIAQDGSVTCETDDTGGGSTGWGLTGNAGTIPSTNYIGTTDNTQLSIKVNNIEGLKLLPTTHPTINAPSVVIASTSNSSLSNTGTSASIIVAGVNNNIKPNVSAQGIVLMGGFSNTIQNTVGSADSLNNSFILGGQMNTIEDTPLAAIVGGTSNKVIRRNSVILGGSGNLITRQDSVILGGTNNVINADVSVAAGTASTVSHIGSFVWNDSSTFSVGSGLTTTADNQFLIRALGGVGIGTNAPASPLHVKGQGTTVGTLTNEVVMTIEPKAVNNNVALAINRIGSGDESAIDFTTNNFPDFAMRVVTNATASENILSINSYNNSGVKNPLMSFYSSYTDLNATLYPELDNSIDLAGNTFRWKHIYSHNITSTNGVNVDSDRRLKDNIEALDYGLADILSMRPVKYFLKADQQKRTHLGLIAQEVESIMPEIVNKTNDKAQMRSMRYGELIPVLIKATQEQQTLIEQQSKQITELKYMLEKLLNINKT